MDQIKKAFVIASLRRASYRWKPRYTCLNNARVERGKYKCAKCESIVGRKEIQVDHINPIVPLTGFDSFDGFIERLFCEIEDLQALCKPCHKAKSKIENQERRVNKYAKSNKESPKLRKKRRVKPTFSL